MKNTISALALQVISGTLTCALHELKAISTFHSVIIISASCVLAIIISNDKKS